MTSRLPAFICSCLAALGLASAASIDLAGEWALKLDKDDRLPPTAPADGSFDDQIRLPGTTDLARKGKHVTAAGPFRYHLIREWEFTGPAYYKRKITVPADWSGLETELFLERVMWQSRVWIDGTEVSTAGDSLNTPHRHRLGKLPPGEHELVIRVDNRMIHPIGDKGHAYGDQTQSIWNGIVGKIELRAIPADHISDLRVFPSLDGTLKVEVGGEMRPGLTLSASCREKREGTSFARSFASGKTAGKPVTLGGKAVANPRLWSDASPAIYEVAVALTDQSGKVLDTLTTSFGFRTVSHEGNRLLVNGRPAFMRGNLECAVFPKTGHPPVTVEEWRKIWQVYKAHHLNHARFHSWCPPEAAFTAADEEGIYLQVEAPIWIDGWMTAPNPRPEMDTAGYPQGLGKGDRTIDSFTLAEIRRTLDTYGNHPSFVFFCLGNELGTSNFEVTGTWIRDAKAHDSRHLYAASTARTITPFCDFNATHAIPGIGWCRQHLAFGTDWDYEPQYGKAPVPIIAHEIGQWPVYVDWEKELPKYTGPLKPYRLQDLAAEARKNGLYDRAAELRAASGASNRILYRDEIESFLRTPSCRGFQLLGMQDFSGQGEALIGWLDSFYESKGTTDPAEFRRYCAPTVPLLKLPGYAFKSSERPVIEALIHHYGPADLEKPAVTWTLAAGDGTRIGSGALTSRRMPAGAVTPLGNFTPDFSAVKKPTQATLDLAIAGIGSNRYNLWIYPDPAAAEPDPGIVFTSDWAGVAKPALEAGKPVVLSAHFLGGSKAARQAAWAPLYWSVPFFPGQNTETIGLLVHPAHPALAGFPTPPHADWNWYRICQGARGFDLTEITTPDFRGIAEPVSDFHYNRRLASIFEAKVGPGKLLVCGYNITDANSAKLPEVASLRRSLLDYAASERFRPGGTLEAAVLDKLFENPELKLPPLPERFAKADLYVNAAGKLPVSGQDLPWSKDFDHIMRQAEGVDYEVKTDGDWRDAQGTAWHGRRTEVMIKPRAGVPGTLHVRFHDWNRLGRTGTVSFEGKTKKLEAHVEGVWLDFPVIREDTNDSRLILTAETGSGPNLMITDIAFTPDE